jgi:hypothetical protein
MHIYHTNELVEAACYGHRRVKKKILFWERLLQVAGVLAGSSWPAFFFLFSFLVPYSGVDEAGLLGSQGVFFP